MNVFVFYILYFSELQAVPADAARVIDTELSFVRYSGSTDLRASPGSIVLINFESRGAKANAEALPPSFHVTIFMFSTTRIPSGPHPHHEIHHPSDLHLAVL